MTRLRTAACLIGAALVASVAGATASLAYEGTAALIAWCVTASCVALPLGIAIGLARKDGQS